ncbi:MAG: hypothetical protein EOM14_05900 [Clostridia bacterium]|nr:hypothetical protein [Clostridia bacterium]
MSKNKFYVGQRVEAGRDLEYCGLEAGALGTIVGTPFSLGKSFYAVDFDKPFSFGHDCDGLAKPDCGRYVSDDEFTVVDDRPSIKIYAEDAATVAIARSGGRKRLGAALCNSSDTFDYAVGGVLALSRALNRDPAEVCDKVKAALSCPAEAPAAAPVEEADAEPTPAQTRKSKGVVVFCEGKEGEEITEVGCRTLFHDRNGKLLVTGDVVQVYDPKGEPCEDGLAYVMTEPDDAPRTLSFIAALAIAAGYTSQECYEARGPFIAGLRGNCNSKTGEIFGGWSVEKVKRYTELEDGEEHTGGVYRASKES